MATETGDGLTTDEADSRYAPFGAHQLPIEVLVIWRPGPWHVTTVLYREHGTTRLHPSWNDAPSIAGDDIDTQWNYLAERVLDGSGGNWYTYELGGFECAERAQIDARIAVLEAQALEPDLVAEPGPNEEHADVPVFEPSPGPVDAWCPPLSRATAPQRFALTRIRYEPWMPAWDTGIPWMYRALASRMRGEPMLRPPRAGDDVFAACAYWTPLLHLLIYSFGWSRPDLGLKWWYDAGQPTDDDRLAFIADVWLADGDLDWFAAFLWSDRWIACRPFADLRHADRIGKRFVVDDRWVDEQVREAELSETPNPLTGGSDPLHLTAHCDGPLEPTDTDVVFLRSRRTTRQAVLSIPSLLGWYRHLTGQGETLPDLGTRSWHVDVFVKEAGWLGTYRRSRRTGLWFAGRHALHEHGNPG